MKPYYFKVSTVAMHPTVLKNDIIEGFVVETLDYNTLNGVYVIMYNDNSLIGRVNPDSHKDGILKVVCNNGCSFLIPISEIRSIYKADRVINRHIN